MNAQSSSSSSSSSIVFDYEEENDDEDDKELLNRALGSFLGLAVGDALGATVEFMTAR